jgi:AraC-like DNA-binding protein
MYQEHPPDIRLTPFIETYWTAIGWVENGDILSKILPDGCVDILFSFGDASAANGLQSFLPNIVGTTTTFIEVIYTGKVQMFGIRFKPAGITAFTRVPIDEFTNQRVDMTLVDSVFDEQFYDTLPEKKSIKEILQQVDTYLLNKLSYLFLPDKQMLRAVDLIEQAQGQLLLADVASRVCLGQRHFERKFKSTVGISPKTFSKIVKFKNALRNLKTHPHESLFSIAIDCGYYDQTHLIKDFKALTGDVPTNFR